MEENIMEKTLIFNKKGKPAIWTYTNRYTSMKAARCGYSSVVCYADGKLSPITHTLANYVKVRHLARITRESIFIQAKVDIHDTLVEIFKIQKIDNKNRKVLLEKVATYKDGKWDTTEYLETFKRGITSVKSRAKKYYSLRDIK